MQKNNPSEKFKKIALHPIQFKLLMLLKLPMVFITGIKIKALTDQYCSTQIRFKYLNQNPFKSIYFACLAMAAELSTGALAMMNVYGKRPSVSMLVLDMKANFDKKAVGKILFTCENGKDIQQAVENAISTKEGQTVKTISIGKDEQDDTVAQFEFTWTFKSK